jgi:carboxyl-terminal processing protease
MKHIYTRRGRMTTCMLGLSSTLIALLLAGCGGGGGSAGATAATPVPVATAPSDQQDAFMNYWNMCATPRTGIDAQGKAYPDKQGTLMDELRFLRGWSDQYYLWYQEIPTTYQMSSFTNAIDYFKVLKTPALTETGQPKDKFHFTYPTAEWEAMTNSGQDVGYGITWSASAGGHAPRTWLATEVEPGSPAAAAGIQRGDLLTSIDGVDFINAADSASIDKLNAGLYPSTAGETHNLTVQRGQTFIPTSMISAVVSSASVKNTHVFDTPTGKVGYLTFDDHNAVAEQQLIDAFNQFKSAGVSDLVLDMRYNGGGLLYVASELAYMVAGPAASGKVFQRMVYNDKIAAQDPLLFLSTAYGFSSPHPATAGAPLPYLGLKRVTVLTTGGTCSASEAVINGLRGVDVEVNLIGGQTCGKPYGFTPVPNCGTTYFSIEFKGANAKGYGDFSDGMAPTCSVADDLSHPLGDPAEGMLAAALNFQAKNACPVTATSAHMARAQSVPLQLMRPEAKEVAILTRAR